MQNILLYLTIFYITLSLVKSEAPVSKRPLVFNTWPPKNAQQIAGKQRTLVVQIRSDQPVPFVLKGRPAYGQTHAHAHLHPHALALHHAPPAHIRGARPLKLTAPLYMKQSVLLNKPFMRKPLKIKLSNSKIKPKPAAIYDKPFKYEKPNPEYNFDTHGIFGDNKQKLPLETHASFITEHFAPIHTIPAPNLALQNNHINSEGAYLPPQQHESSAQTSTNTFDTTTLSTNYNNDNHNLNNIQYQVVEENTNDQNLNEQISGAQKLQLNSEHFNQPTIDVQSNHLPPAQPLVQIVGPQHVGPEIYPIQFTQQTTAAIQPFVTPNVAAPIPLYNPTYLVTQSNNLYSQHKQQLFKPVIGDEYINADLSQQLAANGAIIQSPNKEHLLDSAPQFAALIAAPALGDEQLFKPAAFRLQNSGTVSSPEGGFVVSNFYGNAPDNSQLLQAYAEEEHQNQRQQEHDAQQLLAQQQNHLFELQQQQQQHQQQIEHQKQLQQQQQQQQLEHQQQIQLQLQQEQQEQHYLHQKQQLQQQQHHHRLQQQQQKSTDSTTSAFEEHARLVKQQLGADTPLRIFVPDEDSSSNDLPRLRKRSEMELKKGTVENAEMNNNNNNNNDQQQQDNNDSDMFEVSSSVEVSNEKQTTKVKNHKH